MGSPRGGGLQEAFRCGLKTKEGQRSSWPARPGGIFQGQPISACRLTPAEGWSDLGQNRLHDMDVVGDAELVGDG